MKKIKNFIFIFMLLISQVAATFQTTPIRENFNRANADPMTGWTSIGADNFKVLSNACQISSLVPDGFAGAYFGTTYSPGPFEAYYTLSTKPPDGNYTLIAIILGTASSGNGYAITLNPVAGASNDELHIYRLDAFIGTEIGSLITQEFSNGDGLGIGITSAGVVSAQRKSSGTWTSLGTATDTTYTSPNATFYIEGDSTTTVLDDIGGGSVGDNGKFFMLF